MVGCKMDNLKRNGWLQDGPGDGEAAGAGQVYGRMARTVGPWRGATLVRTERVRITDVMGRTVQVSLLFLTVPSSPPPSK